MRKIIIGVMAFSIVILTGCNRTIIDTTYRFDKAIITLQNGDYIEVDIKKWCDYDGEQIQIVAKDGTVYLVNSVNCTLIKE